MTFLTANFEPEVGRLLSASQELPDSGASAEDKLQISEFILLCVDMGADSFRLETSETRGAREGIK